MTYSTKFLCDEAGITPRQSDYWISVGYIKPLNPNPGYGNAREWPSDEVKIAKLIKRLIDVGFTVEVAASVARDLVSSGEQSINLGNGCLLIVDKP